MGSNNGYNRWKVVVGAIICQFVLGANYTWSVFQIPLAEMFGWSTSEVSLAFSINLSVIPFLMIIAGKLLPKYGPTKLTIVGAIVLSTGLLIASQTSSLWMLYLGYGVLAGSGIGIAYGISVATCVKWFPDKRGMIAGLVVAGFGLGSVIYAPIATLLVENYGPLNAFFYQTIYAVIGVSISAKLMKSAPEGYCPEGWSPPEPKIGESKISKHDFLPREMLKTSQYWIMLIVYTFSTISGLMIIGHASPIGQQIAGLTPLEAGLIVSVLAIANTIGRLFWGALSDRIGRTRALSLIYIICAIAMFSMNILTSFWLFALGVALIAFGYGGAMGTFPALTADFFGPKHVSINYGLIFIAYSLGALIGPRLAAIIVERTVGDYTLAFIISGVLCVFGAVIVLFLKVPVQTVQEQKCSTIIPRLSK